MGRLILRLVVTAAALFVAIAFVPGVDLAGVRQDALPPLETLLNLFIVAVIFGLVNAIIKPLLKGMTCTITCLTLGLFIFVINALMLFVTALIAQQFDIGFVVDGPIAALAGSIIVSAVSLMLSLFIPDKD